MMALNVETENTTMITLNTDTDEWWLWTPNEDAMKTLNAETGKVMALNANEDAMMALNTKRSETWLWGVIMSPNVKLRSDNGSERWNRERKSERQTRKWWWL